MPINSICRVAAIDTGKKKSPASIAMVLVGLIFVVSGNIFNVAVKDIAQGIDCVHADSFVVLQAVEQGFAEMILFM